MLDIKDFKSEISNFRLSTLIFELVYIDDTPEIMEEILETFLINTSKGPKEREHYHSVQTRIIEVIRVLEEREYLWNLSMENNSWRVVEKKRKAAIWVPGFNTEPFTLSECNSKLDQYRYKLFHNIGAKETNQDNINKFNKAIKLLS